MTIRSILLPLATMTAVLCAVAAAPQADLTVSGSIVLLETRGSGPAVQLAMESEDQRREVTVEADEQKRSFDLTVPRGEIVRLKVKVEGYGLTPLGTVPGLIRYEGDDVLFRPTSDAPIVLQIAPLDSYHFRAIPIRPAGGS